MSKLIARMFLSAMLCTVTFWGGNIRAEELPTRKSTEQQPTRWEHYNQYARWSFGANIGLPFFAGDFQSNSYDKLYWGIMADLQGGYQFTPVIGLRANLGYAQGKTGAKDFEQDYWLDPYGWGDYRPSPLSGSMQYKDLYSKVRSINFTLHADINLNNLIRPVPVGKRRWTVSVSPGIYFQKFYPDIFTRNGGHHFAVEHFNPLTVSLGGEAMLRWKTGRAIDLQARYGINWIHQNVFDGREALGHDLSATDFSDSREEELIRLLCKKDVSAIDSWFQDFSRWLTENFRTKSFTFIQIYSLLGRILKFFYELNLDTHDLEAKILYVYNHLEEFHTTEELCGWLNELCRLLCRKLDSSLNDYHQKLCESVTSYIDENYTSNTLCLNDIASEANVSPAYLSALFKKKQGVSISDYSTTQRINAACRYLTATNMTLKEISMKCGYANQYYFSTSFKKKMNVTPSAYRDTQTSKS